MAKSKWDWEEADRQATYDEIDARIAALLETMATLPVIPTSTSQSIYSRGRRQKIVITQPKVIATPQNESRFERDTRSDPTATKNSIPSEAPISVDTVNKEIEMPCNLPLTAEQIEAKIRRLEDIIKSPLPIDLEKH